MNNELDVENLLIGANKAKDRLFENIDKENNDDIFFSLAETIFWISSIFVRIDGYDKSICEEKIKAIYCANNFIKHNKNIVDIIQKGNGATFPISFPLSFGTKYLFKDISEVKCKVDYEKQKIYYKNFLYGKEIKPMIQFYIEEINKVVVKHF